MELIEEIKRKFNNNSIYWASNFPKAWSLGWMTQLAIALIVYPLTFIVGMLIPMSLNDTPSVELWYGLGFIPAVFWSIFILYRLVKYNSEKLFGNRNWAHNFIELPSYLLQFIMPLIIPFMLALILIFRIGSLIELKDLNKSKVNYEEAQPFFTMDYGGGNYSWRDYDYSSDNNYSYLHDKLGYYENDEAYYESIVSEKRGVDNYIYNGLDKKDSTYLYNAYLRDSINQENKYRAILRDSIANHRGVFVAERPQLYPLYFYKFDYPFGHNISSLFSSENFYYSTDSLKRIYFYKHHRNETFVRNRFDDLMLSFDQFGENTSATFTTNELWDMLAKHVYSAGKKTEIEKKASALDHISLNYKNQINYIEQCKDKDFYFMSSGTYFIIIFSLLFAMMLIISLFKNLHWLEFLVGLFIVLLIPILLGIIMAIMSWNESSIVITFWTIFIVFLISGFIEQKSTIRRKRGAVLLMIMHLCMAYVPLAILGTLDEFFNFWQWSYFDQYLTNIPTERNPNAMVYNIDYYGFKRESWTYALCLGYMAYLFLFYPLWIKVNWLKFAAKPKKS